MKCLAIDDEPLALRQLENYIRKTPFLELACACYSAAEAAEFLKTESVDVIITDINMPDCNGIEFVKSLQSHPIVVLSTAYGEYALEGYSIDAAAYLLKPYSYQEFFQAMLKVRQYYEWHSAALEAKGDGQESRDCFFVRADNRSVKVVFDNIVYVEAMSEYIKIHFKEGKPIMTFLSLKLMGDSLPSDRFMRIHRSYLVALDQIASVHKSEVVLHNGTVLPISATYKDVLMKYISERTVERK